MATSNHDCDKLIVVRRPIKHARLKVREDFCIEAIVPLQCTDVQVQAILDAKAKWIERALSFFKTHPATLTDECSTVALFGESFELVIDATLGQTIIVDEKTKAIRAACDLRPQHARLKWYRTFARDFLRQRTNDLAAANGFAFNRIYVMNQKTVWGNCSRKQNVSLNWQLIRAPRFVIDYVILHELLHTRFMSHGQAFWRSMSRLCTRQQEAIAWLHANRPVAVQLLKDANRATLFSKAGPTAPAATAPIGNAATIRPF